MISSETERIHALVLFSGGLDSQLAVCLLRDQGICVHGILFDSPFFETGKGRKAAENLGLPLFVLPFASDIISLLKHSPHGYGSCMNPCIDCHARMLRRAGELMEELNFHFLATGEVLGERPMSQNRKSLDLVAHDSGYEDLILRPLSARLLPDTGPEREGWVDREKLGDIQGRSRKPQLQLAAQYGLTNIPTPAGGCLLTEPGFCRRLSDLKDHEGLNGLRSIELLRLGRHFRLDREVKMIIGRDEQDNAVLEGGAELYDLVLKVENIPGPIALLPFTAQEAHIRKGAEICARYSDCPRDQTATVRIRSSRGVQRMEVRPAPVEEADRFRI